MTDKRTSADEGFTLVELLVVVSLMSVLGALGLIALRGYADSQDQQGSADEVVSTLRLSAQRSLTEGVTYCVHLHPTAKTVTTYRAICGPVANRVRQPKPLRDDTGFGNPTFTPALPSQTCPTAGDCVYFYPRGTASQGTVTVVGSGPAISIEVKGLTSRVTRS